MQVSGYRDVWMPDIGMSGNRDLGRDMGVSISGHEDLEDRGSNGLQLAPMGANGENMYAIFCYCLGYFYGNMFK